MKCSYNTKTMFARSRLANDRAQDQYFQAVHEVLGAELRQSEQQKIERGSGEALEGEGNIVRLHEKYQKVHMIMIMMTTMMMMKMMMTKKMMMIKEKMMIKKMMMMMCGSRRRSESSIII